MGRTIRSIDVRIDLLSPLSHGAFAEGHDTGNAQQFRREPIVSLPGAPQVPVISGNALRGILRRLLMRELIIEVAGITPEWMVETYQPDAKGRRMWDRLYAALVCGGTIEEAERRILPEELRELRGKLPPLSLLGSALYSSLMAGVVSIGFAWPVCHETIAGGLVDPIHHIKSGVLPAEYLITDVGQVRHIDRELANPENSGVSPMPVTIESLATGTVLESRIDFQPHATPLEISCLAHGLDCLTSIGGKSGSGFGRINVHYEGISCTEYGEWISQRAPGAPLHDELRQTLTTLAESF